MGFFDTLSDIAGSVGGAVDTFNNIAGGVSDFKNSLDSLTSGNSPTVDLSGLLSQLGGGFGGFGGTSQAVQDKWPKIWEETEHDGTVVTWRQEGPDAPHEILFVDPGASAVPDASTGPDPLILGVGALALVMLLK